ncbi:hypothetical protein, partial [Escherichia coli]|uniref:hypothetical protein n=1 Tax=Escherichia coli TaxID=562 RepID=UPI001BC85AB5
LCTVSEIFVVTHATEAGDPAVPFVIDEWHQIPITEGWFCETGMNENGIGNHSHMRMIAYTAFFTNRTVLTAVGQ